MIVKNIGNFEVDWVRCSLCIGYEFMVVKSGIVYSIMCLNICYVVDGIVWRGNSEDFSVVSRSGLLWVSFEGDI